MSDTTLALGRLPLNLSLYAKVAAHEAKLQNDVVRLCGCLFDRVALNRAPGVSIRLARNGGLHINVSIVIRYGADVNAVGTAVQEAILDGVQRISDRPVATVNVTVAGFEVAKPERKPYEKDPVS